MSELKDKGESFLKRAFGAIVFFAILGVIVLGGACWYLTTTLSNALK